MNFNTGYRAFFIRPEFYMIYLYIGMFGLYLTQYFTNNLIANCAGSAMLVF